MSLNISEGTNEIKKTKKSFDTQVSAAEQFEKDGEKTDELAGRIDGEGLDSGTADAIRDVLSGLSEAYTKKITEVEKEIQKVSNQVKDNVSGLRESEEKVNKNAETYEQMASVSDVGRAAAESGRRKMESDSQEYGKLIEENEAQMEEAEEKGKSAATSIRGMFKR